MTVAPNNRKVNKQAIIDLAVALVAVPLLVVFGLMLETNMRGDWTSDADTRWHVLGLGLALLFISLLVMGYVTHRLGICIWQASQNDDLLSPQRRGTRPNGSRTSNESQLSLVVSGELPPSYESVVSFDMPPPYCSILVFDEKNVQVPAQQPKQPEASGAAAATDEQSKQCQATSQQVSTEQQPRQNEAPSQQPKQSEAPSQQPRQPQSSPSSPKQTTG